jgi:hypothetical protein
MTTLPGILRKKEKYNWTFIGSLAIHAAILLLVIFGGYLFPKSTIRLGTGPGGGSAGDSYSVGMVDELSGGAGMVKPSIVPQPPALVEKELPAIQSKAIPLPEKQAKKQKLTEKEVQEAAKAVKATNVIPTQPEPGSGGSSGRSGGSGGRFGGGVGISIGSGYSGGFGNSTYARTVEGRISRAWTTPPPGVHVEIIYSFYIAADGSIGGITLDKSCGNTQFDKDAEWAIRQLSNPRMPPTDAEFGGRLIKFVAQFIYPPNQ